MRNQLLDTKTAESIDKQVRKILRDLGNPRPPLRMEHVLALLSLDRQYYSATNTSWLQEKVHKLKIAGKQILLRPTILLDVVRQVDLKALIFLDQKRILIDEELPKPKIRWTEAHEVTHSILPWHHEFLIGDSAITLSPTCHEMLENEANYGAGRLLFLQEHFAQEALSVRRELKSVQDLAKRYGNTITSTLWRFIEHLEVPAFGLVSGHPARVGPAEPVRYFIRSKSFTDKFSQITEAGLMRMVRSYCGPQGGGPLGYATYPLTDDSNLRHEFQLETFFNRYEALTLGVYCREIPFSIVPGWSRPVA